MTKGRIVVNVFIKKPLHDVWQSWTKPEEIKLWNIPFSDWHCPQVENDVKAGGRFCFKMETKDGKEGFEHAGRYDNVIPYELIEYTLDDGRKSAIEFMQIDESTIIRESFEPEKQVPDDIQENFCQSVLQKLKTYMEEK